MEKPTRIRYFKAEDNSLHSKCNYMNSTGQLLTVVITPDNNTITVFQVLNEEDYQVLTRVECQSLLECKKVARIELEKLGVSFYKEVRKKKEE